MNIKSVYKKIVGSGSQEKIIKGVFWSFLGTLISKGFAFIALFLVARILSVQEYGKLGLLQSYINTFTLFSLASFGVTATKYLAIYNNEDKKKASEIFSLTRIFVFILSSFILILSYFFNDAICEYIVGDPNLKSEVLICGAAIYFSSLNGLQVGALAGLQNFKSISIVNIVNGVLSLPLIIISAYHYGIKGVVVSLAIINFSIWACSAILLKKELLKNQLFFTVKNLRKHFDTLYHFSLPSFLSSIMLAPVVLICNSFLIKYNTAGYYELGIYNAAFNFSQVGTILIGIIGQVFYPMAMQNFGKNNRKFDFFNINNSYIIGILIFLPIVSLPDLFAGFYGIKYENNNMYYSVMFVGLSSIVIAQRQGIARNFAAGNFMWFSVFSNLIWAATTILSCYLLISKGSIGRSLAFFIGYITNTILFIPFYINKKLIDKKLLLSKEHLLLIFCILISNLIFTLIDNLFFRIIITIVFLVLCLMIFKNWFKSYIKNG
ncbi:oligosaccharide flippase family protein [Chryseobacterium flavum]|uniref:oligosaccharide flippase family protein n=1 Tax=Chryseobacterium flavum TaxID=415851 RepID=UPI0028B18FAA|nr:oligosaccharide flippase family protein [Chryseobacterium flavum]